ncbi:LacI family DNA-binding transcriptional regulator [Allokutzneria sp. NRRL B-24872]|uniref:LacI family DNA-binding transcriptional regulator n=1 Tax=Allokutzneria sp. NRRL B-24872 TaxID=1137961 RepID=UPI001AF007E5|nr:LacI family DNA-binding transcriptional regulator [Allokutzneria sp. NRRL B-24872]
MTSADSGPATIETIARRAGVSIASVSRVLNGLGGRPDTVRKVQAAATELGYVPNAMARSLRGGRSGQIAFAMEDIGNPVYVAMVRRIQAVAKEAGYRLLLHSTGADREEELRALRSLADRHTEGLIISPIRITREHLDELSRAVAPVVVIGSLPEGVRLDNVRVDSRVGAAMAVAHLVGIGRRRIGFLNGPLDTVPGQARYKGYLDGLATAGLDGAELVESGQFQTDSGAEAAKRLLERVPDLDGLFCANDLIAVGALRALREAGRRVPDDVAVVGMDDTELARVTWPTLTSVGLGSARRGELAAELLVDRLGEGRDREPRWVSVTPELVARESTRS